MKYFFILFITLCAFKLNAQTNLVLNPSFEDTLNTHGPLYYLEDWIYNWHWGRGYFNSYQTGYNGSVPSNEVGYQYPHTGNAYCGIYTFAKSAAPPYALRNYIKTKLSHNLIAGKKYRVAFYVSLADTMHANNNTIGAYFAPDSLFTFANGIITNIPQIENETTNDLSSKTEWTLVCDTFIATSNERWMTIGNFYNDSLSTFTPLDSVCAQPNPFNCASYYYIDDVSVTLIDETGIEEHNQNYYIIYPNPNGGAFELITTSNNLIRCELSDITGRVLEIGNYKPSGNKVPFSFESLPKGFYNIKIIDSNKSTTIKIVIN